MWPLDVTARQGVDPQSKKAKLPCHSPSKRPRQSDSRMPGEVGSAQSSMRLTSLSHALLPRWTTGKLRRSVVPETGSNDFVRPGGSSAASAGV